MNDTDERSKKAEENVGVKVDPELFVWSLVSVSGPMARAHFGRLSSGLVWLEYLLRQSQSESQPSAAAE